MGKKALKQDSQPSRTVLRRVDQACAGALLGVSLLAIGVYLFFGAVRRDRLIDVDRTEPRHVEFLVDINSADWPELELLPGIGETLARRIVESRQVDGPFVDHSELQRVRGIGPKTLEEMRPYLLAMPDVENVAGP